jgi:phosphopantetheinyl transferase (holo-ACP synthase)
VEVIEGAEHCELQLHGEAARRADELGVFVTISLSHVASMAAAVALALPARLQNEGEVESA